MNRYDFEGLSAIPILRVADIFAINEFGVGSHLFSKSIKSVFLNLSGAITTSENINIQTKRAEGGGHTGANGAAVLTDSNKAWVVDALIGKRVYNVTDGSAGTITDNTADTVTASLGGGTDDDWDTGDRYLILDAENRFLQAVDPSEVTATQFLFVMDSCELFSDEVLEIEFANTDDEDLLVGSNVVYE
jgi:hypothetical protein